MSSTLRIAAAALTTSLAWGLCCVPAHARDLGSSAGILDAGATSAIATRACDATWRRLYFSVFKASEFGRDRSERAAWVIRQPAGGVSLLRWPFHRLTRAERWDGRAPDGAVALIHSHPTNADPRPSRHDVEQAGALGLPVYAISRWGVFKALPGGEIVASEPSTWFEGCDSGSGCGSPAPRGEMAGSQPAPVTPPGAEVPPADDGTSCSG